MQFTGARGNSIEQTDARPVWLLSGTASVLAALLMLLSLCGCSGSQRESASMSSSETRVVESPAPAPALIQPQPDQPARATYRARSAEEVEHLFEPAPRAAYVPPAPIRAPNSVAPAYSSDEAITAERSWDVQITREWRHIVVHHSASAVGSASIFDKAHRERGWDGLGYHFVIGNGSASGDGEVEVGYRWARQIQGAHAGNADYNQHGIGICLVGDFQNGGTPSAAQMNSLRRLVRFLQVKTGIPTSEVIGHGNVPGKQTECPGRNLDVSAFRVALGGNAIPIPIHYSGGGVSNGRVVRHPISSSAGSMSVP
jgi:N-acetylmuramoyl-L-alanine amidase